MLQNKKILCLIQWTRNVDFFFLILSFSGWCDSRNDWIYTLRNFTDLSFVAQGWSANVNSPFWPVTQTSDSNPTITHLLHSYLFPRSSAHVSSRDLARFRAQMLAVVCRSSTETKTWVNSAFQLQSHKPHGAGAAVRRNSNQARPWTELTDMFMFLLHEEGKVNPTVKL